MSQTDNNTKDILNTLANTANQLSSFFSKVQDSLTPDQRAMLDKELGGTGAFNKKMNKTQKDLDKVMSNLNNFNK